MSYDITITDIKLGCPTCARTDEVPFEVNFTSNIRPMLVLAGVSFQDMDGERGQALRMKAATLLNFFTDTSNHAALADLDAPNGWGTLEQFLPIVREICTEIFIRANPHFELCS